MRAGRIRFAIPFALACVLFASCGGGGSNSTARPVVNSNGTPIANAGVGGNLKAGEAAALDCSASSDPQNDVLSYEWLQLDGPTVQLSDSHSCNPVFNAPDATTTLTFRLKVSDTLTDSTDKVSFSIVGTVPIPNIHFTKMGAAAGLKPYSMAIGPHAGVAAADFNADGFIDIFVPNGEGVADQLYVNQGDGTFSDVAENVGLDSLQNHRSSLWVDYDGDHDLDLVIGGDCRDDPVSRDVCEDRENLWLYRQGATGSFENVSEMAGLDVAWGGIANWHRGGISAGDINNDGYLELLVIGWHDRAYLFLNNANGTFTDIAVPSGVTDDVYAYQQAVFHDFDHDGWVDLYMAVDGQVANRLYINQKDNTFSDAAQTAGIDNASTDMGIALGDVNNDGRADIYVTEITQFVDGEYHHNQLYVRDTSMPDPAFLEVSESLGVQNGYWGWGTTFIDYDNDGWQDLATTNGKNLPSWNNDRSKLWRNTGIANRGFDDVSVVAGFNDDYIGAGLIAADFDRDGDLDLLQTTSEGGPLQLLSNNADSAVPANNYISIKPRMPGRNHWAIGARVTLEVGSIKMVRVITAGTSTDSQEPAEAHFGLGTSASIDSVAVDWPGGQKSIYIGLEVNTQHMIIPE